MTAGLRQRRTLPQNEGVHTILDGIQALGFHCGFQQNSARGRQLETVLTPELTPLRTRKRGNQPLHKVSLQAILIDVSKPAHITALQAQPANR